jgi:hypothetical protein
LNALPPESKIIGEELDAFITKARQRLNELKPEVPLDELSREIRDLVALRFVLPTARTASTTKRARNSWNNYTSNNYKSVKMALGISPFLKTSSHRPLGDSPHKEVIMKLKEDYKSRSPEDESESSTNSSRSTPCPTGTSPEHKCHLY